MARTTDIGFVLGVIVVVLVAVVGGAKSMTICSMDSTQLAQCLPAIRGPSPSPPTKECCAVIQKADMHCLCSYKHALPNFGVNPGLAMALPKKCGLNPPPECDGKPPSLASTISRTITISYQECSFLSSCSAGP